MTLACWYAKELNFGDLLTPWLIETWTGAAPHNLMHAYRGWSLWKHDFRQPESVLALRQRLAPSKQPEHVMVGSILGWGTWHDDVQVVWGTGFVSENTELLNRPRELRAVRGELTLAKLPRGWQSEVAALGDPGVLIGDMVETLPRVPGRIGFVPHYIHKKDPVVAEASDSSKVHVIDIQQGVEAFIKELSTCETVVASAMHGIICADGLGIPTRWVKIGEPGLPAGGLFKFHDYFSAAGNGQDWPDKVSCVADILRSADSAISRDVSPLKASLLDAAPFQQMS
ncbi:MAG: polysaccharide pyruvyl transferase family protein [Rhodobacteraceae bacterium]|nr:polysaccharide pyruvyl transferase family protein [Paracoccaceae bacterium]